MFSTAQYYNSGSNSTGEKQLLERKKKRPCANAGLYGCLGQPGLCFQLCPRLLA